MDTTSFYLKTKIIAIQAEIDRLEDIPKKSEKRIKQLKMLRDYLYKKLGEVNENEKSNNN